MHSFTRSRPTVAVAAVGWALAILTGWPSTQARAQQSATPAPSAAAAAGGAGWYSYVPGQGWVPYSPPSATAPGAGAGFAGSVASPGDLEVTPSPTPATPPAPGWAGYAPATPWYGYAPASSPYLATGRPVVRRAIPPGPGRRRAANAFVNRDAPGLAYTLSSYREFGSGRPIPLIKPWLPPSP